MDDNHSPVCPPARDYMRCEEMSRRFDEMKADQRELREDLKRLNSLVTAVSVKLEAMAERLTRSELRSEERLNKIERRVDGIDGKLWKMMITVSILASGGALAAEKLIGLFS